MPIFNDSNAPLDFTVTTFKQAQKPYLRIGFTDQQIKTNDIAGRVFNEPTGFFSWIYNLYQNFVSQLWGEISVKVIAPQADGSNTDRVSKFAMQSSVFRENVKNLPQNTRPISPLSESQALEDIKYSHFIDIFFTPSQDKLALWNKLGPPFSEEIKQNLKRALADPENWTKIPISFLEISEEPTPLQKEVQEILLSQLDKSSMLKLQQQSDCSQIIRKVFINGLENALIENDLIKIERFKDLIKSLSANCDWIKAPLVKSLQNAVSQNNLEVISKLLPEVKKRCPENIRDLVLSHSINNKAIFKELLFSFLFTKTYLGIEDRIKLIEKAIQIGCVDIIPDVIDYNNYLFSDAEITQLQLSAFSSSLKEEDATVAESFLKKIQIKKSDIRMAVVYAIVNRRKDICSLLLNQSNLSEHDQKVLRGYAFYYAVRNGLLDFAQELFGAGEIPINDIARVTKYSIDNKEVLPFLLKIFPDKLPSEVFQSMIHVAHLNGAPSIFLELFLSNKLTQEQQKTLKEQFKKFIELESKNMNTSRNNLIVKHQQINTVLEELSKNRIHYDYPFDSIDQDQNFRFYRQAVNDFPEKFLEVIGQKGLPSRVEFLGEEGIDAGGLFRDFVGHIIEGLIKENSGVLEIDRDTGLPLLKESADFDPQKKKSRDDFVLFGYFLSRLYDYNKDQLNRLVAAGYRPGSDSPCVIGHCFDQSLFTMLNVADNQQKLESALKDHIKKMLFSKGESLGWAEKAPAPQLRYRVNQVFFTILNSIQRISNPSLEPIQDKESWALFTTSQYGNTSQSPEVTARYKNLLEAQKMLITINEEGIGRDFEKMIGESSDRFPQIKASYEKLLTTQMRLKSTSQSSSKEFDKIQRKVQDKFEALVSLIKETIQKSKEELLNVYESEGKPRPTHCVFLNDNPTPQQLILAESLNKGITFERASFEDLTGVSLEEKLSDYAEAIKEIKLGLTYIDNGLSGELASDPIAFSKKVQGEEATIESLMNALRLPSDASLDMQTQKGWIRQWLEKDPNNLTKFIKSITGANQLPLGKNISLEAQDRIFIHTCFFSMDLYSSLPPQVTKEKFFDRIEESISNKKFTGA